MAGKDKCHSAYEQSEKHIPYCHLLESLLDENSNAFISWGNMKKGIGISLKTKPYSVPERSWIFENEGHDKSAIIRL